MKIKVDPFGNAFFRSGFDVVVNCTGFGAKSLCKDPKMVPIRGQVFKVRAPWMKMVVYGDSETYIIPGRLQRAVEKCLKIGLFLKINKLVHLWQE